MNQYINIFIDNDYPNFIDKYLTTDTLTRLKHRKNNSHTYGRSYGHQKHTFSKIIKTK